MRAHEWAPLPLRLVLGAGFIIHGYPKVFAGAAREQFAGSLGGLGVPLPEVVAWLVGLLEFFGGIALVVGVLTVPVALLGIANMLAAMFLVHLPNGFKFTNQPPGIEVNLLYIAGFLALVATGAGVLSVDRAFVRWRSRR